MTPGRKGFSGAIANADLRLLRVFRTVVENEGFAASEIALGKSTSAISLDISKLEQRLGAVLCLRGKGGFRLTEEGRIVYNAALQLFADIGRFEDRIGDAARAVSGRMTLSLIDNIVTVAQTPLVEALKRFRADFPNVVLTVESLSAEGVVQSVLKGTAEIGISVLPRPLDALDTIALFEETLLLYCGRDHPLAAGAGEVDPAQVRGHRLILPSVADDPLFDAMVREFPTGARSANLDGRLLLLLSGGDLGFLPPQYADPWVRRGELRAVRPDRFRTVNTFYLVTRKTGYRSTACEALLTRLLTGFRVGEAGPASH